MSTRRRSARPDPARRRLGSSVEMLETRQLLSQTSYLPIGSYPTASSTLATNPGSVPSAYISHPVGSDPSTLVGYGNEGKFLSGQDRQGNRWTLTLTGPGEIIVTDVTPNDSVLDDNLNTIRLIGTNINTSSLVGQVEQSARTPTDYTQLTTLGELKFDRLVADNGVKSIILNGFVLTDTVTQPGASGLNSTTGIQLHGGVGNLSFEGINAPMPASQNPVPIVVSIGDPTTPLTVKPTIRIDHIYNTVFDDTAFTPTGSGVIPTGPVTSPSVSLVVNGAVADFNVVSITQQPDLGSLFPEINGTILTIPTQFIPTDSAALEYQFPTVGTTGRTAIQAKSIDNIKLSGGATNVTFSKAAQPFQSSLTGLDSLKSAQFGGPTDALAIDVKGNIGGLKFAKGLGNPAGLIVNPTNYGRPASANGYAASGNLGGQIVTEGSIGHIVAAREQLRGCESVRPRWQSHAGLGQFPVTTSIAGSAFTTAIVAANGSIGCHPHRG